MPTAPQLKTNAPLLRAPTVDVRDATRRHQSRPPWARITSATSLQPNLTAIEVRCLPRDLPEQIPVDVSGMQFGDILRVSEIPPIEGVEILTSTESIVVSLASLLRHAADEEEVAAPAAEGPAAQPAVEPARAA